MTPTRRHVDFADYLAEAGDLPANAFIGLLVTFSFKGARRANVSRAAVERAFSCRGLSTDYVPSEEYNAAVSAYRNATGEKQAPFEYKLAGRLHRAEIKHVSSNADTIVRTLWTYEVTAGGRGLHGREVGDLVFVKGSGWRIDFSLRDPVLLPDERPELEVYVRQVYADFQWYQQFLYDQPLREMTRSYLRSLRAICVEGGLYFVHRSRWEELRELGNALADLHPGFNLHLVPLVDTAEQRAVLIEQFQNETADRVSKLVERMQALQKAGRRITASTFQQLSDEVSTINATAEEHARVLEVGLDRNTGAIEVAYELLAQMASDVR